MGESTDFPVNSLRLGRICNIWAEFEDFRVKSETRLLFSVLILILITGEIESSSYLDSSIQILPADSPYSYTI
jgi:hypothetical protein